MQVLLTYDTPAVMKEMMSTRSDKVREKREFLHNLRNFGQSDIPVSDEQSGTQHLLKVLQLGMGMDVLR